ncbi:MAG: hypothetical protein F6K47_38870 [Symploca sp. SIO2E6]|nr:hypothetical protein [Symploca sp. SIO2E6]
MDFVDVLLKTDEEPRRFGRFLKKFSRNPPLDWRRNSVLAGASPEEQEKYKQYLQRLAIAEGRQGSWVYEQLSLELGV